MPRNAIVEPSVRIRRGSRRSARSASQVHFVDLCEVLKPKDQWSSILGHSPDVADALIRSMLLAA